MSTTPQWDERMELARRRCSEIIDLDQDPPVKYGAVHCKNVLKELDDLDKLHSQALQQERSKIKEKIERMRIVAQSSGDRFHDLDEDAEDYNNALDEVIVLLEK